MNFKLKIKHSVLFLIIAYSIFNTFFSFSQDTSIIDSLKTVIDTTREDTIRLKALIKLAEKCQRRGQYPPHGRAG